MFGKLTVDPKMAQIPIVFSSTISIAFLGSIYNKSFVTGTSRPSISKYLFKKIIKFKKLELKKY